jgi:hypothetical protein
MPISYAPTDGRIYGYHRNRLHWPDEGRPVCSFNSCTGCYFAGFLPFATLGPKGTEAAVVLGAAIWWGIRKSQGVAATTASILANLSNWSWMSVAVGIKHL